MAENSWHRYDMKKLRHCQPMYWRNLANTIELVLPSAHPSPQPKRQVDRFCHFCIAHGRVSSGMPGHVLSPNNFTRAIWAPSNTCFLGLTRIHNPNDISIGSAVFARLTCVTDRQIDRQTDRQTMLLGR